MSWSADFTKWAASWKPIAFPRFSAASYESSVSSFAFSSKTWNCSSGWSMLSFTRSRAAMLIKKRPSRRIDVGPENTAGRGLRLYGCLCSRSSTTCSSSTTSSPLVCTFVVPSGPTFTFVTLFAGSSRRIVRFSMTSFSSTPASFVSASEVHDSCQPFGSASVRDRNSEPQQRIVPELVGDAEQRLSRAHTIDALRLPRADGKIALFECERAQGRSEGLPIGRSEAREVLHEGRHGAVAERAKVVGIENPARVVGQPARVDHSLEVLACDEGARADEIDSERDREPK